jgi:hypothetical protein
MKAPFNTGLALAARKPGPLLIGSSIASCT